MSTIEKALEIALNAHKGQTDKAGQAYILHPISVMQKGENLNEKIVGLLHDVVEDSDYTITDIKNEGFSLEITTAIEALTKKEEENYDTFIQGIINIPLARKVKINDITDNLNVLRLNELKDKDLQRINKYLKALKILKRV
ncbi:MAG: GTP pyrophosphokinase [Bacteroidales bacterium]|nr:GTP pyrophosphokinase [Bacteroidales bacterium]